MYGGSERLLAPRRDGSQVRCTAPEARDRTESRLSDFEPDRDGPDWFGRRHKNRPRAIGYKTDVLQRARGARFPHTRFRERGGISEPQSLAGRRAIAACGDRSRQLRTQITRRISQKKAQDSQRTLCESCAFFCG